MKSTFDLGLILYGYYRKAIKSKVSYEELTLGESKVWSQAAHSFFGFFNRVYGQTSESAIENRLKARYAYQLRRALDHENRDRELENFYKELAS